MTQSALISLITNNHHKQIQNREQYAKSMYASIAQGSPQQCVITILQGIKPIELLLLLLLILFDFK